MGDAAGRHAAGGKPRHDGGGVVAAAVVDEDDLVRRLTERGGDLGEELGEVLRFVPRRHDDRDHRFVGRRHARAQGAGPPAAMYRPTPVGATRAMLSPATVSFCDGVPACVTRRRVLRSCIGKGRHATGLAGKLAAARVDNLMPVPR